ncbi:hypothetical protein U1Q18_004073 [Sarracenia purpurea var. burkii]
MALSATGSKVGSCNHVQGAGERSGRRSMVMVMKMGRRGLLLPTVLIAAANSQLNNNNDSRTELLKKYLKKSQENKSKNDKERLDGYYKRNYKDYFDFVEGDLKGKKEPLSEAEKGILDWLQKNK